MKYQALSTYDLSGSFTGYAIHKVGTTQLESVNLYDGDEANDLDERVHQLNEVALIRANWPASNDPDVEETLGALMAAEEKPVDENARVAPSAYTHEIAQGSRKIEQFAKLDKACEIVARKRAGLNAPA
jgi:hypothetical protein